MSSPRYIDPDKPMMVMMGNDGPKRQIEAQFPPESAALSYGLTIAIATLVKCVDERDRDHNWRLQAYRDIYENITDNNHLGTGSEAEKSLHLALEVVSQALGLFQKPR